MLDLHLHSLISDGEFTPSEVVKKAKQNGVSILSLTDHDSIGGIEEAEETCKKLGIQFIPGVELEASTDITRSRYIHILAYNFSNKKVLDDYLHTLRQERIDNIIKYVELLNSLGIYTSFEEIDDLTPGLHITAYHIPILLCQKGYYDSFSKAKKDFINPDGKYYIERNYYDVKFIINLILKSGGVPVLAHPCRLPQKGLELDNYVSYLKQVGIVGIETYYKAHTSEEVLFYETLAQKYDLIQTSGSDWHCENDLPIGLTPPNENEIISNLLNYNKENC